jgi:hypothetical protein
MDRELRLRDVVALVGDLRDQRLRQGRVGTIVELLSPGVDEVEFSDNDGRTYASASLRAEEVLLLHHEAAPSQ